MGVVSWCMNALQECACRREGARRLAFELRPVWQGEDLQEGGCPHCGDLVEVRLEDRRADRAQGRCPTCGGVIAIRIVPDFGNGPAARWRKQQT